jgi:PEP-CTERM motif
MRSLLSILALASFLATSTIARADTITWIVSIVGSGTLGALTFTDKRITLIDTATTENYYEFGDFGGPYGFSFCCADSSTATIEGIGTFGSAAVDIDTEFSGSGLEIGDTANRLSIASGLDAPITPESIGPVLGNGTVTDACDPDFQFAPCPGYIETTGGSLIIDSFNPESATGEEILSAVPEPGTFILIGSGLLAMCGVRRTKVWFR